MRLGPRLAVFYYCRLDNSSKDRPADFFDSATAAINVPTLERSTTRSRWYLPTELLNSGTVPPGLLAVEV